MHTHLAEYVWIRVILQKHCGCACIVVACCNVQCREADLSLGAVVDEEGYNIFMALLKSHGKRRKSILQHTRERELQDELTHREKNDRDARREAHDNKTEWKHSESRSARMRLRNLGDSSLKTSLSSSVPQLECSDLLHSPEETSQPLDGFLVQPCRVEWNPSVSERRRGDRHPDTQSSSRRQTSTTTKR